MAKRAYLLTKHEGALRPFDADTEQRLERFPSGVALKCTSITQPRSIPFQGYYWATLANIIDATEVAPTSDALHDYLVKATGRVTWIQSTEGKPVDMVRDSTAFDAMDETEFSEYVQQAQRVLAERLGLVWDDFTLTDPRYGDQERAA